MQTKLVEDHMARCEGLAKLMAKRYPQFKDDILGYGYLGLVKAASNFDASRGYKFWTYAHSRVAGEIMDGLRELMPFKRNQIVAGVSVLSLDCSKDLLCESLPEVDFSKVDDFDSIEYRLNGLADKVKEAFFLRFGEELTTPQMSKKLGLSLRKTVAIIKFMREELHFGE